jgi:threonine dehydrogenase-like Zn-dependent dehydrogenase
MPVTIGHEFSGTIVELGNKIPTSLGLEVGDLVAVQATIACKECEPCKQGLFNCCLSVGFVGLSGRGGGISDFICLEPEFVFKLPSNISLEVGALVGPLAIAWHAVDQLPTREFSPGEARVLVIGAGPIGLGVIQCLWAQGYRDIIAVEVAEERKNFARQFGARQIIDPSKSDVVQESMITSSGQGPHFAFDCAGVPSSMSSAIRAVRPRGT